MCTVTLENGLDLRECTTKGSILHINEIYEENDDNDTTESKVFKTIDILGEPLKNFEVLKNELIPVDENHYVIKKILETGGGMPLHDGCTVSIAFSGYWENELQPFDVMSLNNPMTVDLKDNGLLPGLDIAVRSMLVGEISLFLFSYKVMYGEMGIPPRIKPKSDCVFYIKLVKSMLTPKEGALNLNEPHTFQRVHHEVKLLYSSGYSLYKIKNFSLAIHLFNKAVRILHKCRLADEEDEKIQEKLLIKLYINLAICYNKINKPLKTCIACNELNRLNALWNNAKALLQNARALRMIGQFDEAEKKLRKAEILSPNSEEMKTEAKLLQKLKVSCNKSKLLAEKTIGLAQHSAVSDNFKVEVENLISNFKENINLCKLTLPYNLDTAEVEFIKSTCIRENLFFNKIEKDFVSSKQEELSTCEKNTGNKHYLLGKENDMETEIDIANSNDEILKLLI
ncbi:inactive peptidyl-prolyl cis-trans isomerase shutdown-like [Bombyx mandarina]|uniref:peptidylprolyl isomerase n=1 Tax=Bombyx mandarina TaxID=7092 RepID=A0A6J2JVX6_BOMMA|nr:inactive peptidyl-prolyl cis-trans isomerase shutdown-like [Bombyx mandarina]